jgi:class 3 adenylate cyclase
MADKATVLYVDDEPGNLTVFEAAFEDDHEILLAQSGPDALGILAEHPVDILVTDMRMPGMTGTELLKRVIPRYPDIIRMVLTGCTDIDSVVQAANQGQVYQYITKPWEDDQVRMLLRGAAEHAALLRRGAVLRRRLLEQQHREETIRGIFQRFAPADLVAEVLLNEESGDRLAPDRVEVSLLYCAVQDFGELCRQYDPRDILALMNGCFEAMTREVESRGGMISRFLGDAILAVFGAPVRNAEHEVSAVRAALGIVHALERFNEETARGIVGRDLTVAIGVHRGPVSVGHVGPSDNVVYSVIGDAVPKARRLQMRATSSPNLIVTDAALLARCPGQFRTEPLGDAPPPTDDEADGPQRVLGEATA